MFLKHLHLFILFCQQPDLVWVCLVETRGSPKVSTSARTHTQGPWGALVACPSPTAPTNGWQGPFFALPSTKE